MGITSFTISTFGYLRFITFLLKPSEMTNSKESSLLLNVLTADSFYPTYDDWYKLQTVCSCHKWKKVPHFYLAVTVVCSIPKEFFSPSSSPPPSTLNLFSSMDLKAYHHVPG